MPRTIRFHLDEHCATALAEGLRHRGIDVTTTPEAGLRGGGDSARLRVGGHATCRGVMGRSGMRTIPIVFVLLGL
jgi:hypothetical protein